MYECPTRDSTFGGVNFKYFHVGINYKYLTIHAQVES